MPPPPGRSVGLEPMGDRVNSDLKFGWQVKKSSDNLIPNNLISDSDEGSIDDHDEYNSARTDSMDESAGTIFFSYFLTP